MNKNMMENIYRSAVTMLKNKSTIIIVDRNGQENTYKRSDENHFFNERLNKNIHISQMYLTYRSALVYNEVYAF